MSRVPPEVSDSRYEPIVQKEHCCVPACIQMVLTKHDLPVPSQDELGYHLGLVVPSEKAHLFNPVRTGPDRPSAGWGTQMHKPEYDFNVVSRQLKLGLTMTRIAPESFEDPGALVNYLAEAEEADGDVLACYDFATRYDKGRGGHVNVFDRILPDNKVRLVEPFVHPDNPDYLWREVEAAKLLLAMTVHSDHMGGLWNISVDAPLI